jgi:hypothetical protein
MMLLQQQQQHDADVSFDSMFKHSLLFQRNQTHSFIDALVF